MTIRVATARKLQLLRQLEQGIEDITGVRPAIVVNGWAADLELVAARHLVVWCQTRNRPADWPEQIIGLYCADRGRCQRPSMSNVIYGPTLLKLDLQLRSVEVVEYGRPIDPGPEIDYSRPRG